MEWEGWVRAQGLRTIDGDCWTKLAGGLIKGLAGSLHNGESRRISAMQVAVKGLL
jgi:hypothetical protein